MRLGVVDMLPKDFRTCTPAQLAAITALAIPLGLFIGSLLATGILSAVNTETVRLPLLLTAHNYAHATIVVLLSAIFSFWVVARQLHSLDLIAVLKARD